MTDPLAILLTGLLYIVLLLWPIPVAYVLGWRVCDDGHVRRVR